jgi:hypothetical protein
MYPPLRPVSSQATDRVVGWSNCSAGHCLPRRSYWQSSARSPPFSLTLTFVSFLARAVAELNERLTTLGIAVNLVTYLTMTMHVGNAEAANVVTNFMGTSFMLCLLGGFVADSFLGRYLTIAIFTAVQASVSTLS